MLSTTEHTIPNAVDLSIAVIAVSQCQHTSVKVQEYIFETVLSCTYPTPLNKTGLLVGFPTIVGAFNRFPGSATIRVCWRQEGSLINNNVKSHLSRVVCST